MEFFEKLLHMQNQRFEKFRVWIEGVPRMSTLELKNANDDYYFAMLRETKELFEIPLAVGKTDNSIFAGKLVNGYTSAMCSSLASRFYANKLESNYT